MIAYVDSSVVLRFALDAIHLATAQLWGERMGEKLVVATHDAALAMAARAVGMRAIGVPA